MKKHILKRRVISNFCKKNNYSIIEFAKKCNFKNPKIIYLYDYGLRLPNIENLSKLQKASNNEISYNSFIINN